ncbi:MAG: response regulator receiver [Gemmatimonadetes bacterium]|nr:response regulator receiver [Gemmatimonadota bacterium]
MQAVPTRPQTVLIVEDQMELRAIHTALLEHHGYRVLAVGDGEAGLRCAREQHPDLILMDVSVPGIDGIRATRQLKDDPRTGHIPVVIVTAHPYGSVGSRVREAGCDGFIGKPCDPRRILQEVRQRLGMPSAV